MNSKYRVTIPIIIAFSVITGMYIAKITGFGGAAQSTNSGSGGTNKLDLILEYINREYVDTVSQEDIVEATIPHLLEQLDPHSGYIPAQDFDDVNDPLEGEFEGIGVQFNIQNDTVVIVQVIAGGPSEMVNIKAGDRIVSVNDSVIAGNGISSYKVVKLLKGPKGTKVSVGIHRRGSDGLLDFTITRDKIPFYSIDVSYMINQHMGYIKISRFAMTTYNEFKEHIAKLQKQGMNKLVLDLRNNGGGILDAAIQIANEFLDEGKTIVYTEGKAYPRYDYISTSAGMCKDVDLVILLNEQSASASEVLAGAIQDNDRGTIVGRRSFGKGLVMSQKEFSDGSAVRLTISRYYTATGRCIQKPYTQNHSDYFSEIYLRNTDYDKDSIFPDSLRYTTAGGKVVYGGGGIMPDYYVSIDTSEYSDLVTKIVNKGLIYDFAFDYADVHRNALNRIEKISTFRSYLADKDVFNDFITSVKSKGIEVKPEELERSEKLIKNRLFVYIVRDIRGDEGFYPMLNETDDAFIKAVEVLK